MPQQSKNQKLATKAVNAVYKSGQFNTVAHTPAVINTALGLAQQAHVKSKRPGNGPTKNQVMNAVVHHPLGQSLAWVYTHPRSK
jgi:hypothetical protein